MDVKDIALGLAFAVMWSSAFASARIILMDAPPLWSLALRFAISGGLAVGIARAMGQSWRLPRAQGRAVVIFGLCQNALYLGLFFVAMQKIEASLASIIASAMPLIVAGLGWAFRGERVAPLGLAGLVAGF
ncbi:MAG: DMT family transporter, partial [Paracoccaceae bacterium]